MILLLDAGNTYLKWALVDQHTGRKLQPGQSRLSRIGRLRYDGSDLEAALNSGWSELPDIGRVILAGVADTAVSDSLQRYIQQRWGQRAESVQATASGYGVVNAYAEPGQLGVDRWLALIAARRITAEPVSVVDCGTAVTIDRLDAGGQHLGGLILPGLSMQRQALSAGAAGLSSATRIPDNRWGEKVEAWRGVAVLAQATVDAVVGGVLTTVVASIDRCIDEIDRKHGVSLHVLTGGDGPGLQPLLSGQWILRPDLVLEGLAIMAEDVR